MLRSIFEPFHLPPLVVVLTELTLSMFIMGQLQISPIADSINFTSFFPPGLCYMCISVLGHRALVTWEVILCPNCYCFYCLERDFFAPDVFLLGLRRKDCL